MVKNLWARERGELGAIEKKVISPGKIVPYKCCIPSSNIRVKEEFDTNFFLTSIITHFQVLSVKFSEYARNVNKHNISDKAILGKMCGVYVTNVADADKRQWHVDAY